MIVVNTTLLTVNHTYVRTHLTLSIYTTRHDTMNCEPILIDCSLVGIL